MQVQGLLSALMCLFVSFLFACGLYGLSAFPIFLLAKRRGKYSLRSCSVLSAGSFVIAIVIFCLGSNFLMLIPPLMELLPAVSQVQGLLMHRLIMIFLLCSVGLIALFGLLLLWEPPCRFKVAGLSLFRFCEYSNIGRIRRLCLSGFYVLATCFIGYLFVVTKGDGLNGDTGLYHLPNVVHLANFGIEWGLANWDLRYTTYSLQFFGQAPFQYLLPANGYVSPSLNIYFLAALLMLAVDSLRNIILTRRINHLGSRAFPPILLTVLAYFCLSFVFGLEPRSSLISFNPDFSVACVSIIGIFYAAFPFSFVSFVLACVIALFLPLFKITGVFASFAIAIVIALRLIIHLLFDCSRAAPNQPSLLRLVSRNFAHLRKSLLIFLVAGMLLVLVFCLTSFIMSGYLLVKASALGPFGHHAVPIEELKSFLQSELLFNRTQWYGISEVDTLHLQLNPNEWFDFWRNGKEGKIMLGCLGLALISGFVFLVFLIFDCSSLRALSEDPEKMICGDEISFGLVGSRINKRYFLISNLSLSLAISLSLLIGIFLGPPQPRFYSWTIGISFYLPLSLAFLYPLLGFTFWSLVSSALMLIGRPGILEKSPIPKKLMRAEFHWNKPGSPRWKTRSFSDSEKTRFDYSQIIEHADHGPGCWSVEAPCSLGKTSDYR